MGQAWGISRASSRVYHVCVASRSVGTHLCANGIGSVSIGIEDVVAVKRGR